MNIAKIFVAIFYSIIVFFIWIPILVRIGIIFSYIIIIHTFSAIDVNFKKQNYILKTTALIYIKGFNKIFSTNKTSKTQSFVDVEDTNETIREILWALLFWGSILIPIFFKNEIRTIF